MESVFYRVVSIIPVLGIMIVVHELGHFLAAKFFKVRVEAFSIGFGKPLLKYKWGETEYRLSPIPLGGYVKMAGETPLDERSGDPGEFMSHPRWQRLVIAFAGPFMNILLAVGLLTGLYMVRYEHPAFQDQPAVIGSILPDSPADKAGIKPGDRIAQIGDDNDPTWEQVGDSTMLSANQPVNVTIQRGNERLTKSIVPVPIGEERLGHVGWLPDQPVAVVQVEANAPAAKAGIQAGDEIKSVNDMTVGSTQSLLDQLQKAGPRPVRVKALRSGQEMVFEVTPALLPDADGKSQYRLGIKSGPTIRVDKLSFSDAFSRSVEDNKRFSALIFELVHKMIERKVSISQIQSPIRMSKETGDALRQGAWTSIIFMMSAISLNLGIFNLFPIPILDGGLILLLLIEGLIRRDISQPIKERIYQAAFVCLILFAGLVIFNDVMKEFAGFAHRLQ
jgi:regulator of sigma E protease